MNDFSFRQWHGLLQATQSQLYLACLLSLSFEPQSGGWGSCDWLNWIGCGSIAAPGCLVWFLVCCYTGRCLLASEAYANAVQWSMLGVLAWRSAATVHAQDVNIHNRFSLTL